MRIVVFACRVAVIVSVIDACSALALAQPKSGGNQAAAPTATTAAQRAARRALEERGVGLKPESFIAYASQPDMVRLFLDAGMPPDALAPGMEETVLFYVSRTDCDDEDRPTAKADALNVIEMLIAAGADPNRAGPNGHVPLTIAARCAEIVDALLTAGARLDGPSPAAEMDSGQYVMDSAIPFDRADVVRTLIGHGYDVAREGARLLEKAQGRTAIETVLREAGAAPAGGRTTARAAAPRTRDEAKRELAKRGLEFSQEGFWWPLMKLDADLVTLYLEAGMAPSGRRDPPQSDTPLLFVTSGGCAMYDEERRAASERIALALIAHGAEVNAKDVNDTTPLTHAAGGCPVTVVRALLAAGASTKAKSKGGATPMMMAVMGGHDDNVIALLAGGYDVSGELGSLLPLTAGNARIAKLLTQAARR